MIEFPLLTERSGTRMRRLRFFQWIALGGGSVLALSGLLPWRFIPAAAEPWYAELGVFGRWGWSLPWSAIAVGILIIGLAGNGMRTKKSGAKAGLVVLVLLAGFVGWVWFGLMDGVQTILWAGGSPEWWPGPLVLGPGMYVGIVGALLALVGGIGITTYRVWSTGHFLPLLPTRF